MGEMRALRVAVARTRSELGRLRHQLALVRLGLLHRRYLRKYNPDQPRVPAGSPEGGEWTSESGGEDSAVGDQLGDNYVNNDVPTVILVAGKAQGHHFVPQGVYRNLPLQPETRKVFDEATTGPLHGERHGWSRAHKQYNDAVRESLDRYMHTYKILPHEMTADQARSFVQEVKRSGDVRIRDFNLRIFRQEFQYRLRLGPRRQD